jgi:predicted GIY-YIG superfamily endonuclease
MRIVQNDGGGVIYVIKASETMDSVYKIGRSDDFKKRLQSHNSILADSAEIIYVYKTNCVKKVESCMKAMLKEKQYRKYKEVYQVDLASLKTLIKSCDDACMSVMYNKPKPSKMNGGYYALFISRHL